MASSMKDIKLRIHSVESTMQITRAMELVAASKLRRAQERMERSRPYFEILHETIHDIAGLDDTILSPYVMQREVKRTCWIVIAGDRGLAGGFLDNTAPHQSARSARRSLLFRYAVSPLFSQFLSIAYRIEKRNPLLLFPPFCSLFPCLFPALWYTDGRILRKEGHFCGKAVPQRSY